MKFILLALTLLMTSMSFAQSFSITDHKTGKIYSCQEGRGKYRPSADDLNMCMTRMAQLCDSSTTYSGTQCFDKATEACPTASPELVSCAYSYSSTCNSNTTNSGTQCFDKAMTFCKF